MNNKLLTGVLILGIASTGFAALSNADDSPTGSFLKGNSEVRELMQKVKAGEDITAVEQTTLDEAKANYKGKRSNKGMKNLTDEERAAVESMTIEEKTAFFTAKKEEMKAQKESSKAVIAALIAGEVLTADQETLRGEMIAKMTEKSDSNDNRKSKRVGSEAISKLLAGEALTEAEQTQLTEMQAKHAERAAQKEILSPIMEKKKSGAELTEAEQTILDEAKSNHKGKGGHKKGPRGER